MSVLEFLSLEAKSHLKFCVETPKSQGKEEKLALGGLLLGRDLCLLGCLAIGVACGAGRTAGLASGEGNAVLLLHLGHLVRYRLEVAESELGGDSGNIDLQKM